MKLTGILMALTLAIGTPLWASTDTWDAIKSELYDDRVMLDGQSVIAIDAPYRSPNDARTDIAAQVIAPKGLMISKVTLVLDENPMPVSAVFELTTPQPSFFFDVTMRVNGPTPLHVIAEASNGQLWVVEGFVKTSGLGACSAPPGSDPEEALATLGQMHVGLSGEAPNIGTARLSSLVNRLNRMDVDISHPSHSGMQMDQISLLFIPMRYVENVEIGLDGAGFVNMTGSISLSENPRLGVAIPRRSQSVDITMTDTDGTETHLHKKLGGF